MSELEKHAGSPNLALLDGSDLRFGVVLSRYNESIGRRLLSGTLDCLQRHGVIPDHVFVVEVPGAWEIPLALRWLARRHSVDALVALGVVIRGDTPHFDFVCSGCTDGCRRVSEDLGLPVGFGVLTCDDVDQAEVRAGGEMGNKGWEAAETALEMANLGQLLSFAREPERG